MAEQQQQDTQNAQVQGDQEQQVQAKLPPNTTNTNPGASSGTNAGTGTGEPANPDTNKDPRTGLKLEPAPGVKSGTNTTEGVNMGYGDTVKTIEEQLKEYNPNWKPDQAQNTGTENSSQSNGQ